MNLGFLNSIMIGSTIGLGLTGFLPGLIPNILLCFIGLILYIINLKINDLI